jgi:ribosomal protein S18 acetylase RimI-like enzyme
VASDRISFQVAPEVRSVELNRLFRASWPDHHERDFEQSLDHSLTYVCCYREAELIGFVNVAWDGGVHAFILDVTVLPDVRRRGLGVELVTRAAAVCRERGIEWLHVDYEAYLAPFYDRCGFRDTAAGLIQLVASD